MVTTHRLYIAGVVGAVAVFVAASIAPDHHRGDEHLSAPSARAPAPGTWSASTRDFRLFAATFSGATQQSRDAAHSAGNSSYPKWRRVLPCRQDAVRHHPRPPVSAPKGRVRYQFWMRSNSVSTVSPKRSQLESTMPTSQRGARLSMTGQPQRRSQVSALSSVKSRMPAASISAPRDPDQEAKADWANCVQTR